MSGAVETKNVKPRVKSPSEQWASLKEEVLEKIEAIDKDTPWQECEPEWWLEMMEVDRVVRAQQAVAVARASKCQKEGDDG